MLAKLDSLLDDFTMYKGMTYGLISILIPALFLGMLGKISIAPAGLLISITILCASCYLANTVFSRLISLPSNTESWLISALIMACILPATNSVERGLSVAIAGVIAMASKYIIAYHGKHIFNPAAFGVFVVSLAGLVPAIWWIATPWMTPFVVVFALIVLHRHRYFQLFGVFVLAAFVTLLATSISDNSSFSYIVSSFFLSWPIIFFGSAMLTDPGTLPPSKYYKILLAALVGVLFTSQIHVGIFGSTPQAVLLLGNLLAFVAAPAYSGLVKIKSIIPLTPSIAEIVFDKPVGFKYKAGQYVEVTFNHPNVDMRGNRRTFSIASAPDSKQLSIAFKYFEKGSSMKRALLASNLPKVVRLSRVDGEFTLPADKHKPLLFIAGGIGITPFRSMILSLKDPKDIILLYIAGKNGEFVWRDEFDDASKMGVQAIYKTGRIHLDGIKQLVPDMDQRLIYVSGPTAMVVSYRDTFVKSGLDNGQIITDRFNGY